MKYVLIDGNNLAIRSAFANDGLKNDNGEDTSVHYGFFNSLKALKEKYPAHQFLVVWDGKSKRRKIESEAGVKKKIIPSAYKENRKKEDRPSPLLSFYEQSTFLKKAILQTGIPQIRLFDYEADDVVASYCEVLKNGAEEVVLVTSDKDYFQLLGINVSLYDGMKEKEQDKYLTIEKFFEQFEIEPPQYIDVGALMGDIGDNIFGIPGWGLKSALKAIREHETYKKLYKHLHTEYDPIRNEYPDLSEEEFEKLASIETKSKKKKYPEITSDMPFTGVALAFEEKRWKPEKTAGAKQNIMALMFEERVHLAYSLKKMDSDIGSLPSIAPVSEFKQDRLLEYFDYYGIESLKEDVELLN